MACESGRSRRRVRREEGRPTRLNRRWFDASSVPLRSVLFPLRSFPFPNQSRRPLRDPLLGPLYDPLAPPAPPLPSTRRVLHLLFLPTTNLLPDAPASGNGGRVEVGFDRGGLLLTSPRIRRACVGVGEWKRVGGGGEGGGGRGGWFGLPGVDGDERRKERSIWVSSWSKKRSKMMWRR